MNVHRLRTWPAYFELLVSKEKTFEIRRNDRDYQTGDTIIAQEWDFSEQAYTGRELHYRVGFVATGALFGLDLREHAVLSLVPVDPTPVASLPPQVLALMHGLQRRFLAASAAMHSSSDVDHAMHRQVALYMQELADELAHLCGMAPPDWAELNSEAYRRRKALTRSNELLPVNPSPQEQERTKRIDPGSVRRATHRSPERAERLRRNELRGGDW